MDAARAERGGQRSEHLLAMTSGLDDQLAVVAVPGERVAVQR